MTKRDRIVVSVLVVVAVLGAFFMFVVRPAQTELADLREQQEMAEQRRDAALANLASAQQAREQFRRDQATLAVLGKAVPADDSVPSLLYQLQDAARRAKIDFQAVTVGEGAAGAAAPAPSGSGTAADGQTVDPTPGTQPGPGGLTKLPLKITFRGSFFELERFLRTVHGFARFSDDRLDVVGRLLTIDAVGLVPGNGGLPNLKAQIVAGAYIAPKGAPAAATPATSGTTGQTQAPSGGTQSGQTAAGTPAEGTDS